MRQPRALPAGVPGALLGVLLTACMAGPDYVRPPVEVPQAYKEAGPWQPAQPRDEGSRGDWWSIFADPELATLLAQIDVANQIVLVADARYRAARALVRQAHAGLFPEVSGAASATRTRAPGNGPAVTTQALSLDASWEVDLWGRIRRTVEADTAAAQAGAADLAAARLSARAELAGDYLQLRVLDAQKRLLEDTVAAYARALEITRNRYAAGVAGRVDVAQAQTQLESTRAQALDVGVQRAALEHAIAVLVGKPPADFRLPPVTLQIPVPPVPAEVPSRLLERRPDIAGGERRVAAANAQIGVAKSAYFPSLTLAASGGYQSASLADLLSAPARVWSVGPALAETLFDAGARRAQTRQALANYDAGVADYRQTVLGAFQEVEDNLAALRILEEEARVQDAAVAAARQSVVLTTNQYKAGTVNYLDVVTVQATQLANERSALTIHGQRLAATVALVKALGGGWGTLP